MRDITLEDTIYIGFTTRAFATGIPGTLSGTPVLSVLEENNATPITAGVSVSVDRASVTGLNEATVVATAANGYEAGKGYSIYVSTGTVGGVSAVGEVVGQFTVAASAATVDLANATDGLGAIKTAVDAIPTTAMRGTDSANTTTPPTVAAIADSVLDELLAGHVTADSVGLLLNEWQDGGRLDLLLDAIPTTAMRGTDGANTTTPLSAAQVNAEVDSALNTAIPGTPTVNSINERLAAVDDLTQAAGGGDLAAVKTAAERLTAVRADVLTDWINAGRLDVILDAIKAKTDNQPEGIQKNAALGNFEILMVDSTDHVTPKTGLTVTGQRSVDGGAFANVAGTIAEVGSGIYQFDALAADTNGDLITWKFNGGATADDAFVTFKTVV